MSLTRADVEADNYTIARAILDEIAEELDDPDLAAAKPPETKEKP